MSGPRRDGTGWDFDGEDTEPKAPVVNQIPGRIQRDIDTSPEAIEAFISVSHDAELARLVAPKFREETADLLRALRAKLTAVEAELASARDWNKQFCGAICGQCSRCTG